MPREREPADRRPPRARVPVTVHASAGEACRAVAGEIAALIAERSAAGRDTVLALPTGRTPRAVYDELARLHREGRLSFRRVTAFTLDEYWPLPATDPRSYRAFMARHLFTRVDVDPARAHGLDGGLPAAALPGACDAWERAIAAAGGLDLALLGIGRTGHLAFNEPGSPRDGRTRLVALHPITRADAAADFGSPAEVPQQALTMGLATILGARRVRLLACGARKASIVRAALAGPVGTDVPASVLQEHGDVRAHLDAEAAGELGAAE